MKKGLFIVLEGPDGSGKTTVADIVCDRLCEKGYEIVHTREPGGIDIAEQIRSVILNPDNTAMDARTEALLYAASRRQHLVEKVIPAVSSGKIVICERFLYSSLAYQGKARGIGFDPIISINEFAINGTYPDVTIFLDVDEETGQKRINSRTSKDRLDAESVNFHRLVNEGYREVLDRFKETKIVDATRDLDTVVSDTLKLILDSIND
ncbi:MAG: dTMP kinase [Erysipelotrichaceae bacterium]|nr:dTMP kinase [Erysipelotrichaceae bacterium]